MLSVLMLAAAGRSYAGDGPLDFTLDCVDGTTVDARGLRGTPLVVSVMATWCVPCRQEARDLQKAHLVYGGRVQFLAVFVGGNQDSIREFARKHGVTFPVGRDNGVARQLGASAVPATAFVARDGTVRKKYFGPIDYGQIMDGVEELLRQ